MRASRAPGPKMRGSFEPNFSVTVRSCCKIPKGRYLKGWGVKNRFENVPGEVVVAGLLGGISVDDGPTGEQLAVLDAIGTYYLECGDLTVSTISPLSPAEIASALPRPEDRRRFHHLLVALEAARHPQSAAQVGAVERYASALGVDGPDLVMFRSLIDRGVQGAATDYRRFIDKMAPRRAEPTLVLDAFDPTKPEPELVKRLEAFSDLPEDSLGRAFLSFYERTGLDLPGKDAALMNHFYVAHDMTHVIAGIGTSSPGEIALSGFMVAMNDDDVNFSALLASLVIHEAGFGRPTSIRSAETETLAREGAAVLLGQEMARGALCTADFSLVDHFALAPLPLATVRQRFGVVAPDDPDDGFHIW